jgi:hypothetical protein
MDWIQSVWLRRAKSSNIYKTNKPLIGLHISMTNCFLSNNPKEGDKARSDNYMITSLRCVYY